MANPIQWFVGGLCGLALCSAADRSYLPTSGPTLLRLQASPATLRPAVWPELRMTTPPPVDPTATNQQTAVTPPPPVSAAEPAAAPAPESVPATATNGVREATPVVVPETDGVRPYLWFRYFVTGATNQGVQPVVMAPVVDFTPPAAPAAPSSRATYSTAP